MIYITDIFKSIPSNLSRFNDIQRLLTIMMDYLEKDYSRFFYEFGRILNNIEIRSLSKETFNLYKSIIDKILTLKDKDIAIGSYIIFDGNNDVIDLMLKKSYIDIFNSQDLVKQLMQSAKFFVEVHDNEWQSMCFYQDKNKWYDFLSFLRNKTKVEMVDDWASLPK